MNCFFFFVGDRRSPTSPSEGCDLPEEQVSAEARVDYLRNLQIEAQRLEVNQTFQIIFNRSKVTAGDKTIYSNPADTRRSSSGEAILVPGCRYPKWAPDLQSPESLLLRFPLGANREMITLGIRLMGCGLFHVIKTTTE